MASAKRSKKMRILLIPFFATSHIGPHTDLAVRLAAARPVSVEPSIAVTPANVTVVRSALERHGPAASGMVKIAVPVRGRPRSGRGEPLHCRSRRVAHRRRRLRRGPRAARTGGAPQVHVPRRRRHGLSVLLADQGLPCVVFSVIGAFSVLVMRLLSSGAVGSDDDSHDVAVPGLPGPEIRIPVSELPEFLRRPAKAADHGAYHRCNAARATCLGVAVNTFADLEQEYREAYVRVGSLKRCYFAGPVSLASPPAAAAGTSESPPCIRWLESQPSCSVVYVCFGTYAAISGDQLGELALGLEASGKPFLWVVRAAGDGWAPPEGWEERVGERGLLVGGWAPQTAILAHPAGGAGRARC